MENCSELRRGAPAQGAAPRMPIGVIRLTNRADFAQWPKVRAETER